MRYLVSNIVWGATSLSTNAQARLPRVMIVDAECADEVFERAEERHEGATILSAESEPLGETPSMDDLDKVREATRNRIALGVKGLMRPGYTVEGMSVIMVSPPCETVSAESMRRGPQRAATLEVWDTPAQMAAKIRRVREDSPEYASNRFNGVQRGRHLSTLLYESGWHALADFTQEGQRRNSVRIYAKNGRIIVVEEFGPEGEDGVELFYPSGQQKLTDLVAEANAYAADATITIPTNRVSEGRPVYRVPRRRLHIEDEGGLTFCGELIEYIGAENVTDDVMGTLAHEPKGTCGRCIHYALIEVGQDAGRTAA